MQGPYSVFQVLRQLFVWDVKISGLLHLLPTLLQPVLKPISGPTVDHLTVLPKANRVDPQVWQLHMCMCRWLVRQCLI